MGTALKRESTIFNQNVHRAQARAPRRTPGAPVGGAASEKVFIFFIRDVHETHRASTGEP